MKIACSTSAFKSDLNTALKDISGIGFRYVDLICIPSWDHVMTDSLLEDFDRVAADLEKELDDCDLIPIAVNIAFEEALYERKDQEQNESRLKRVEAVCNLMNRLGIRVGSYYPGYRQADADTEEIYLATKESIEEITEVSASSGVVLGPEFHWQTNLETPQQCERLLNDLPELTVVYDPSHFIMQGLSIDDTEFILQRSHHIHLRGCALDAMQAPVEEGGEYIPLLLKQMRESGYSGNCSIEYLPTDEFDVRDEICTTREYIEQSL